MGERCAGDATWLSTDSLLFETGRLRTAPGRLRMAPGSSTDGHKAICGWRHWSCADGVAGRLRMGLGRLRMKVVLYTDSHVVHPISSSVVRWMGLGFKGS